LAGAAEGDAEGVAVDDEGVDTALVETGGAMEEVDARLDETAAMEGLAARVDEELEGRLDEELVARLDEELVRLVEELVVRLVEELVVRLVEELTAAGPIALALVEDDVTRVEVLDVVVLAVVVLDEVRMVD
jgi:hypothetical protein